MNSIAIVIASFGANAERMGVTKKNLQVQPVGVRRGSELQLVLFKESTIFKWKVFFTTRTSK
jgi:hypothetical protein